VLAALVATAIPPVTLSGQALTGSFALGGGWVRSMSTADEALRGAVVGGEAQLQLGRVSFRAGYREGSVRPYSDAAARDYADGHAFIMVTTVPGLIVSAGPHARAYITDVGTQRWLLWTIRLRGEGDLISPSIGGHFEVWTTVSARVNVTEAFDRATGGEVGMTVQFSGSPIWARLSYAIERARLGGGGRFETVEDMSLVLGVRRP
jgi:hypothetical protein